MRGFLRRLGDGVLTLAAACGVVCIVLVALSFFFDVSVLMFKTGSMEPTIRTGAVAIAHEIPAEDIEVGDVVSVTRPGQLPVTHRVLSVSEPDTDAPPGARTIEMKGDANEAPVQHERSSSWHSVRELPWPRPSVGPARNRCMRRSSVPIPRPSTTRRISVETISTS